MAENARQTMVRRYFKAEQNQDGSPIPGTEDKDVWIDVELLTGFIVETGAGASYKRQEWVLVWDDNDARTTEWRKIYKDQEPDLWVLVAIPTVALFETGAGVGYRRFTLIFDNSRENEARDVSVKRIFHAEFGSGGNVEVDRGDYLDVEVITMYLEEYGAGASYVLQNWVPLNDTIPLTEDLPKNQYRVREEPGEEGPWKIWPAYREKPPRT